MDPADDSLNVGNQAHSSGAPGAAVGEARRAKVLAAAKAWTGQLVDLGGRNTLLYYKDLRQGTLDLTPGAGANDVAVADLLGSRAVRLSTLFAEQDALTAMARRARTIRAKAQENFEERGLQTLYLTWGMATWTSTRGTARPAAPILLRQASLTARGGVAEDFDLPGPPRRVGAEPDTAAPSAHRLPGRGRRRHAARPARRGCR